MSPFTLSHCIACVHNCITAHWTETIPDQVMSQLVVSDCSLWLCSLRFPAGRRHMIYTVHTVSHCSRFTSQFSQLSTTAPHHLSRCSTAEHPPPYHILRWRRHFWPAIRWHNVQHDVTAVLTVYTAVTVIDLNVMVTLSSEDQDGLLGFCLHLAWCNGVVSADVMQVLGILYNFMATFQHRVILSLEAKNYCL